MRLTNCGFGMKLFSDTMPATTGARAAGIIGALALAMWLLPFTR